MARLYADENFPLPVVKELRDLGHDVLTSQEAGQSGRGVADADVVAFAQRQGRAVITNDRLDFLRLHRRGVQHAGIVVCTFDPDTIRLAARIHAVLAGATHFENVVMRVNRDA